MSFTMNYREVRVRVLALDDRRQRVWEHHFPAGGEWDRCSVAQVSSYHQHHYTTNTTTVYSRSDEKDQGGIIIIIIIIICFQINDQTCFYPCHFHLVSTLAVFFSLTLSLSHSCMSSSCLIMASACSCKLACVQTCLHTFQWAYFATCSDQTHPALI